MCRRDDVGTFAGSRARIVSQKPGAEEIGGVDDRKGAVRTVTSYRAQNP
jgi:hypothetical protein